MTLTSDIVLPARDRRLRLIQRRFQATYVRSRVHDLSSIFPLATLRLARSSNLTSRQFEEHDGAAGWLEVGVGTVRVERFDHSVLDKVSTEFRRVGWCGVLMGWLLGLRGGRVVLVGDEFHARRSRRTARSDQLAGLGLWRYEPRTWSTFICYNKPPISTRSPLGRLGNSPRKDAQRWYPGISTLTKDPPHINHRSKRVSEEALTSAYPK